ncbi:MAG: NAD(P)-dependent alcohol dehydrogenase [Sphaerochaetaceae bacterium]|nr:NAD(P)-dependent alcohol dehydrogenase [Sphaerochaetaceae bacterium]
MNDNTMMRVAVMTGLERTEFVERPVPEVRPGEVLVKVEHVGVCGSDLHYYGSGRIGNFIVEPPFVLGHEAGGTVVAVGEGVSSLMIGDRVALEPGKTCGHCEFCKSGRYNLCPDVEFFATPPVGGVFQEYVAHPAELCFKLPNCVSTMEGALIEPLAVGFHAANQAGSELGKTAVVMGAGCIGLMCLMALKAKGVSFVVVVDVMRKRLDKALELGAGSVVDGGAAEAYDELMRLCDRKGYDIVIDAAGSEKTVSLGIQVAKKGGVLVFVGYSASGMMTLPIGMVLDKELTLKSVFRYRNIYPMAIEAVASGKVDLKGVVSHRYQFQDLARGLDESLHHKDDVIKAVIDF